MIQMLVVDVVRRVESNEPGKETPAAEKPSSEWSDFGRGNGTVESSSSEMGGFVALECIEETKTDNLVQP